MKYTRGTFLQAFEDYPILKEYISVDFKYKLDHTSYCFVQHSEIFKTEFKEYWEKEGGSFIEDQINMLLKKLDNKG